MKRSISILLCLALIFSSFSFAFADEWGSSQITSVVNNVSSINTTLSNIYSRVTTISNSLMDSNHSVAYWTSAIASWMSPIYNSLTQTPTDLFTIIGALGYYDSNNTYHPYLNEFLSPINDAISNVNNNKTSGWNAAMLRQYAHRQILSIDTSTGSYNVSYPMANGQLGTQSISWGLGTPIGNLAALLSYNNQVMSKTYQFRWASDVTGYNSLQSLVSFADPDSTVTFTPLSATDGIYKYLNAINTPLARLGYVLASDSRIEAQEAAAANEQAVVDNFIDSSGDGAVPTSSFSDVSGLSSGVTSNLSTDASPAQIWDIFNSDHGSWFSQETANQLDTTTRTRGSEFETPLLDQQMEDIYKSLGGGK